MDRLIFKFRFEALRELIQKHASKLKSTIAEELKNLAAMERPEKRESARREVCLSTPKVQPPGLIEDFGDLHPFFPGYFQPAR